MTNYLHIAHYLMSYLSPGTLLIAEPFIEDETFYRKVIVIIEDNSMGSIGLVLNDPTELSMNAKTEETGQEANFNLYIGGPVQTQESLQFIHNCPDIDECQPLADGIFCGGDLSQIVIEYALGRINEDNSIALTGYCGWEPQQLEKELEHKTWIVSKLKSEHLYIKPELLWKHTLEEMGGEFGWLAKAPMDISLN